MSRETLQHLNTNTLIGFTDKRGHAWHYREEHQGGESNHYPGPVPVNDILRRLFVFFFETYLDQEHGFLDLRDDERTAYAHHTTRMANFDAARCEVLAQSAVIEWKPARGQLSNGFRC